MARISQPIGKLWGDGKHLAIQPELQYVMRAGAERTRKDALVVALRFELSD
jgi:carbohydrate-selective porin OprB